MYPNVKFGYVSSLIVNIVILCEKKTAYDYEIRLTEYIPVSHSFVLASFTVTQELSCNLLIFLHFFLVVFVAALFCPPSPPLPESE